LDSENDLMRVPRIVSIVLKMDHCFITRLCVEQSCQTSSQLMWSKTVNETKGLVAHDTNSNAVSAV